jgi:hypothetical protein
VWCFFNLAERGHESLRFRIETTLVDSILSMFLFYSYATAMLFW